jgi:hypothetical protein
MGTVREVNELRYMIYRRQNSIELYCRRRLLIPGILLYHSNECLKISLTRFYLISRKRCFIYNQPLAERDSGSYRNCLNSFPPCSLLRNVANRSLTPINVIAVWRLTTSTLVQLRVVHSIHQTAMS